MERNRAAAKYPFRWFETLYELLGESRFATILLAELNNIAIAGVVLINSTTTTHYFHNGSQDEFLKFCPNELLVHSALEEAIERGNSYFDFMGSGSNDLSLLWFKEKWGSQTLDIHTYIKDYDPIRCNILELGKKFAASSLGTKMIRWVQGRFLLK